MVQPTQRDWETKAREESGRCGEDYLKRLCIPSSCKPFNRTPVPGQVMVGNFFAQRKMETAKEKLTTERVLIVRYFCEC
jgi:hypothetical protein